MIYAYDRNLRKVHIDETISREEYTCPGCGVKLITRKGFITNNETGTTRN